jgi:hypothetical protein
MLFAGLLLALAMDYLQISGLELQVKILSAKQSLWFEAKFDLENFIGQGLYFYHLIDFYHESY